MRSIISRYSIAEVWHFTDRANLPLIRENGGLFSLGELKRRGISVPKPGGNEWSHNADAMSGLGSYVHLAFVRDHPMCYVAKRDLRIADPIWLKIDVSVILEEGVRFTNDVSNKSGVTLLSSNDACGMIDFEALFTRMDWRDPGINKRRNAAVKSEILVPNSIQIGKILNLNEYG